VFVRTIHEKEANKGGKEKRSRGNFWYCTRRRRIEETNEDEIENKNNIMLMMMESVDHRELGNDRRRYNRDVHDLIRLRVK